MSDYWDSFDCEIQCEEVYNEDDNYYHPVRHKCKHQHGFDWYDDYDDDDDDDEDFWDSL